MTNRQKQNLLQYLEYYEGRPDDIWGDLSRRATEAFQRDYLPPASVDGIFGPITEARILEVIASGEHSQTHAPATNPEDTNEDNTAETGTFWDNIRYWSREEFRCRCGNYHTPYCNGFPVEPDQTLVELVDDIRAHFGRPGHPTSGIRCEQHNADQPGAAANSRHKRGKALDFWIEGVTGETLRAYADADPRCNYTYVVSGNVVHVDVA